MIPFRKYLNMVRIENTYLGLREFLILDECLYLNPVRFFATTQTVAHFHMVHGVLKARILKWFAIPFSSGPHFVRTLHHDPSILGGPIQPGS